ncbi:MAG TPA: S8 family serine peptidase, partial [Candidatus Acidoferrum sp.]|nr:S8 family serine peptidase [Candidatus Acidoferrum sp.]
MTSRRVVLLGLLILTVLALTSNLNSKQITAPSVQPSTAPYQFAPRTEAVKPKVTQVSPVAHISHVVVKFKDNASVRLTAAGLISKQKISIATASNALAPYAATQLRPLFNQQTVEQNDRQREVFEYKTGRYLADLNSYYRVEVTSPAEAEALVNQLNADSSVEIAFVSPSPEPAGQVQPQPATTPNYQPYQDYREVAPGGVDADYANSLLGGDGTGIKICDVEGAWQTAHEDLAKSVGGLIAGTMINDISWRNHGTSVLGEMIATNNGFGVTGICPGANIGMVSIGTMSAAEAIMIAVANLTPGDLILVELHAPGPHYNFESRTDQLGYVCMEYWQDNFDAIQYAWAKGITVIEAAGNGAENFDDTTIYAHLFDTTYRNSHAILAGAGYQAASASDRQRLSFSNYGRRVNLQGYGRGVYSCGYGDLYGTSETNYYTASFSGTSSA